MLGSPDDFGIDVEIIIRKFHIPHQFPDDVLQQAELYQKTIPSVEIGRRHDYRGFDIVTIDGETARDFDDAVWVDRLPNGNYEVPDGWQGNAKLARWCRKQRTAFNAGKLDHNRRERLNQLGFRLALL